LYRGYDGLVAVCTLLAPQTCNCYFSYGSSDAALQVLGDTQDADFPIFRNNTGKVSSQPAKLKFQH
jgi:hypothetical protein